MPDNNALEGAVPGTLLDLLVARCSELDLRTAREVLRDRIRGLTYEIGQIDEALRVQEASRAS